MPATTRKTTRTPNKRSVAARSEVNGKLKDIEFRGLKLQLPATCPGEVLFDIGDDNISATLRTLLGDRQYAQVREQVKKDKLSLPQTVNTLTDFLNEIFSDTYGIAAGE